MKIFVQSKYVLCLLLSPILFISPFAYAKDENQWRVSPRKAKIKNPIPADNQSTTLGEEVYQRECEECHGKTGKGDGPEAKNLEKQVRDFTASQTIWKQSDGAIYSKIRTGRRPMPSFKKQLTKDEIWHVTNYLRVNFGPKKEY